MLNEIILQGRLTADPELKVTDTNKSLTRFSLAVERDFSTGDEKETDFINIVAWNGTAEFITKYFTKGRQMLVKGSLRIRKYQTENGEKRSSAEVVAEKAYFCGDKEKTSNGANFPPNNADFVEVADGDEDLPF